MANIRDVAKHAGVSIATVSTALNGTGPVSEKTMRRIWEAVEAVGYAPNGIARSLRLGRSRLLGLIVSEITNPFFGALTLAVEKAARAQGYAVIVCNSNEDEARELELLELLKVQRVAGILVAPSGQGVKYRDSLSRDAGAPLITIDRQIEGLERDFVGLDNRAAGRMITDYILRLGHRRIAFIGGRMGVSTSDLRFEGFCDALAAAGLQADPALCLRADFRGDAAYTVAQPLLAMAERPTAIVAANNVMALGALQAIGDLGFRCPQDVSVAGIDDFPWSTALRPRLTTVAQPIEEIGQAAVEMLLDQLTEGSAPAAAGRSRIFQPTLIARDSCAAVG
ncbi:LacI family DNA-binding transcriptional regulator [Ferrovibrio sp.]|uniref:LacI family DNA-binding transcriptional regulator n=1 Tax=Ferrovibrio sp. TaxID=1917215 RepID=UPI003D0F2122